MEKLLLLLMVIAGTLAANAAEIKCTGCNAKVLSGDKFCPNCGARFAEPSVKAVEREVAIREEDPEDAAIRRYCKEIDDAYRRNELRRISSDLSIPAGIGRGLLTIVDSPIEVARMLSWSEGDIIRQYGDEPCKVFFCSLYGPISVTSIMGPVCAAADIIAGTIDVLTLGFAGNRWWDSNYRSPYFWERSWWYKDKAHVGGAIGL